MKTVFKYQIEKEMSFPNGSKIVASFIDPKNGIPSLWLELNPDQVHDETGRQSYEVFGTGQDIPDGSIHVRTYSEGPFIWHIYEVFK